MRGKTSREPATLARGWPTSRPTPSVSEVQPSPPPWRRAVKGAGGAGRRREGARATRPVQGTGEGSASSSARLRAGLATGVRALRESAREQGRCLTVA